MKRSAPSLQFLAAADAVTATAMSSPQPFRGGRSRGRRKFSDCPSGEQNDQDIITGDSHFHSVRENNQNFRPSPNSRPFRPPPYFHPNQHIHGQFPPPPPRQQLYGAVPPPAGLYQNQQFNRAAPRGPQYYPNHHFNRPNLYGNQQFNRPNFYENQQFRPRPSPPKALNFRNWEYARPGPPSHCEKFTVLSYNILADYLAIDHQRKLYFHIPHYILDWEWRKRSILSELGWWSADILCFQEVDRFQEFEAELKLRGYNGIWKRRTGDPADGCAIFWLVSRFKLVHEEFIEFKKFGLRDNVAQICVFESLGQQNNSDASVPSASPGHSNKVVICNTHVLFNPKRGDIKLGQMQFESGKNVVQIVKCPSGAKEIYEWIERSHFAMKSTFLSKAALIRICCLLREASRIRGKHIKRWKFTDSVCTCLCAKIFNNKERFFSIINTQNNRRVGLFLPERSWNEGWGSQAASIEQFLRESANCFPFVSTRQVVKEVPFREVLGLGDREKNVQSEVQKNIIKLEKREDAAVLNRCLVGTFSNYKELPTLDASKEKQLL